MLERRTTNQKRCLSPKRNESRLASGVKPVREERG